MLEVQGLTYEQFQYYTGLEKKSKEETKAEAAMKRKEGVKEKEKEGKKVGMKEGAIRGVKEVQAESAERPVKKKRY
jgi:hypothetical protein